MTGPVVFIHLAGAVALLLWASRMVRTGIERAYGNMLRHRLRRVIGNRASAALAGLFLAGALQSATAVALIVSGFIAGGYMSGAIGIATLLGADLGSALMVRLLRHDLSILVPVFLFAGMIAFRMSEQRKWRQIGRISVGLGLLFLSLRLIGEASEPLRSSEILPLIFEYLSKDWVSTFVLAALIAWAFHSSIAALLLIASLCDRDLVPQSMIVPMVLGINFGGAAIAAILTRHDHASARTVPLGNLAIRGTAALIALMVQMAFAFDTGFLGATPGAVAVNFHILFNGAAMLLGLPFVGPIASLIESRIGAADSKDVGLESGINQRVSALRVEHLSDPRQALNDATREVLVLCDHVERMLDWIFDVFETQDEEKMQRIEALDDEIDRIHREIKFYLARIGRDDMSADLAQNCHNLLDATIKLEQAADIISHNMLARVRKKYDREVGFSSQGWHELRAMYDEVANNARLAFNLLVDPNVDYARQLVSQKEVVRRMVSESEARHLQRLREGNPASFESSSIHIDTMRDVKEVNSLLVSLAYPLLANAGLLRESRLV